MCSKYRFTLVELLVVIGVISILASLLLPTITSAMNKVKQIECSSIQKQIGYGVLMYVSDYNNYLPPFKTSAESRYWTAYLTPYLTTREGSALYNGKYYMKGFLCPVDPDRVNGITNVGSYANNDRFYGIDIYYRYSTVSNTSNTIYMGDSGNGCAVFSRTYPERVGGWHNNGLILVFMDGHVVWMPRVECLNNPGYW